MQIWVLICGYDGAIFMACASTVYRHFKKSFQSDIATHMPQKLISLFSWLNENFICHCNGAEANFTIYWSMTISISLKEKTYLKNF